MTVGEFLDTVSEVLSTWFAWKDSFTLVPYVTMVVNVFVACVLSTVVTNSNVELLDQGMNMSGMVSGAAITIVTLTFSLTVLSVQIASQAYSPRLLDTFLKDPVSKVVISVNLGSYAYCYTMNYFLYTSPEDPLVPFLAIHFLSVQMFLILAAFVGFIHFFINGFRLEQILNRAQEACFVAARNFSDADYDKSTTEADLPDVPKNAYKVTADRSGYLNRFRLEQNVHMAQKIDVCVRYNRHIGEFVAEGTILAHVWDANTQKSSEPLPLSERVINYIEESQHDIEDRDAWMDAVVEEKLGIFILNGVVLSKRRSGEMDVTLAIQQLSDTAMRALSPGVNDPQTAIQCMDVLAVVMGRLVDMELGLPSARDKQGNIRLWGPRRSFSYLLSMLDPIRHYGGGDLAVCRRGIRLFGDLGAILTRRDAADSRIPTVLSQMEQWLNAAKQNFIKNSPELASLQALYDHEVANITVAKSTTVQEDETVKVDMQELEITHNHDDPSDGSVEHTLLETVAGKMQKLF